MMWDATRTAAFAVAGIVSCSVLPQPAAAQGQTAASVSAASVSAGDRSLSEAVFAGRRAPRAFDLGAVSGFDPARIAASPEIGVQRREGLIDLAGPDGAGHGALRLSVAEAERLPGRPGLGLGPEIRDVDLTFVRDWPALQFNAAGYGVAVTPHAGLGVSSAGGRSAEAGAVVSLGSRAQDAAVDRLQDIGVRDGRAFGDQGRWYLFAAVSGQSVGLNMLSDGQGGWGSAGWSTDRSSALIGDGQVGVGFRRGAMQAAFGYVHREIKVRNAPFGADNDVSDSVAAFTFSLKPSW